MVAGTHRYEMANVQPGNIVVEHEVYSQAKRSYFSGDPTPPVEEYREGSKIWSSSAIAQSIRFDIRDKTTGELMSFADLLGLIYYGNCPKNSQVFQIGDLAQENRISVYVAITYEASDGSRPNISIDKLRFLNRYYNERLQDREKKILILPDYFNLYKEFSYGQIMVDLGLTAME